jgi:aryl carrier-like protein
MMPTYFVMLDEMPLTPNGKIDRRALPVPEPKRTEVYEAPRTTAEKVLSEIWQAVLGVERVGVQDNFFSLGGDSILSIQVIARARQAGLELAPRQLFQNQRLGELAAWREERPSWPSRMWWREGKTEPISSGSGAGSGGDTAGTRR